MTRSEALRLQQVGRYHIPDVPDDPDLARLARLAAAVLDAPMAALLLADAARLRPLAAVGWHARACARTPHCPAEAVVRSGARLGVVDARRDARFRDGPLVAASPFVRGFAGVPLTSADGAVLGVLAAFDLAPRELPERSQWAALEDLAALALEALERAAPPARTAPAASAPPAAGAADAERGWPAAAFLDGVGDAVLALDHRWRVTHANAAAEATLRRSRDALLNAPLAELLPGVCARELQARARQVRESGEAVTFVTRLQAPLEGWYEQQLVPVGSGFGLQLRDVSARLASERALSSSLAAYRALADFGAAIEAINDVDALLEYGMDRLIEHFGLDVAGHYRVEGAWCRLVQLRGRPPEPLARLAAAGHPLGRGVVGRVALRGEVDYRRDYRATPGADPRYVELELGSQLTIPVRDRGRVAHVVSLSSFGRTVELGDEALAVARNFARRLENALERVDAVRELETTREATFRALGLALEYRDYETKGHTDRVVRRSLAFGRALGLPPADLEALQWGAYLHDIGKIAIPDAILLKPGPLTEAEFALIREHTVTGFEMIRDVPFLPAGTRALVRSHHERFDGTGYPDGLAGSDIPLLARLFALVDVHDALLSTRPYKEAWSAERAAEELRVQAGRQFDPELVTVFLGLVEERG